MRFAVIGAGGQLATALVQTLAGEIIPLTHDQLELTDLDQVRKVLEQAQCDVVINTAAYNQVDRAEDEPYMALAFNGLGPRHLAIVCEEHGWPLVHVSTDYVFGLDAERRTPYVEVDAPGPQSVYASSKLMGEYFVRSICRRHYILRTCGLYGVASRAGKRNFVDTMRKLGSECSEVRVVADQRCTPTAALDLARAIAALVQTGEFGLYHAVSDGDATWHEFAVEIFRQLQLDVKVIPISTAAFGARARRPSYSVLNTIKLKSLGITLPPWQAALAECFRT